METPYWFRLEVESLTVADPIHDPAIPVPLFRNLVLRNTSVVDIPPDEPAPSEMNDTSVTVADPDAGVSSVSMNPIPVPHFWTVPFDSWTLNPSRIAMPAAPEVVEPGPVSLWWRRSRVMLAPMLRPFGPGQVRSVLR